MPSRPPSSLSFPSDISLGSTKLSHLAQLDVGNRIPGYRTSAAFFTSLKANLRLSEYAASPLPSPRPTPLGLNGTSNGQNHALSSKYCPPSPLLLPDSSAQHSNSKHLSPLHETAAPPTVVSKKSQGHSRSDSNSSANAVGLANKESEPQRPLLYWTTSLRDTDSAFALLAASVAEQREAAFRTLLTHPVNVLSFVILLVIVQKSMFCVARYKSFKSRHAVNSSGQGGGVAVHVDDASWLAVAIVWTGIALVFLAAARIITWPYSRLARRFADLARSGAQDADEEKKTMIAASSPSLEPWFKAGRDEVLVAVANDRFAHLDDGESGNEIFTGEKELIVGVLIMHWAPCAAGPKLNKRRRSCGGRSYVKAWAVQAGWRGKGIGGALLDEAARVTLKERGGDCANFAEKHAHAERVLPNFYNGAFDRRDRRARFCLLRTVNDRPWMNNRRR